VGQDDARDVGVVVQEADIAPGVVAIFEQRVQGVALAEAELQGKQTVRCQSGVGRGDQTAIDGKTVVPGEERGVGLVVADFRGEGGGVGEGDVGWVAGDEVEGQGIGNREQGIGLRCREGGEQVGLYERDAVGEVEGCGVFAGNVEGGGGDVDGRDFRGGQMRGERERDGARAGANVENAQCVGLCGGPGDGGFDEVFGFGARDEGVWRDAEGQAVELLLAGEVLQGFVRGAAVGEFVEALELGGGEFGIGVGEEPGAVAVEEVECEGFGVAAGDGVCGGGEGFAERHGVS
jgi:hypothetical protein